MIKKALVEYCAPTLAGIKTGNIFSVKNDHIDINGEIRKLNGILVNKGLRLVPIRNKGNKTLIYLYRPERLKDDLENPGALEILRKKGYPCGNSDCCLVELIRHLKSDESFPHEIGLFLDYPPCDVRGFMENRCAKNLACPGYWKVYGNVKQAREIFRKYKQAECEAAKLILAREL